MSLPQCPVERKPTSICIGAREIPSRYFLAPLAGYTQLAFRMAVRELGGLGLATTDLVQATMLLSGRRKSMDLIATTPADRPLSIQIFSGKPRELARAAKWLEDHGYEGVDINMGCPMAKVNGQGGGARLMCDTEDACRTVAGVVNGVQIPVTVKMRLGWDADRITAPALAREFEQLGIAAVTIHGRTRQQGFHGRASLDGIRAVVEAVEGIPVVGNGDVRTPADALRMRRETGCAAVAIGRGAMLDPWIFRRLALIESDEAGSTNADPSPEEQIDFLVRHFTLMEQQHAGYACILFRKFAGWYGARLGIPEDLEDRLRRFESAGEFSEIVEQIRARHGQRESATPTALVKTPNGPNALW
ncbi:MAG: tRNA-dihydrouridine synthase [Planctomycetota bacterium]|nr:MAG: tRNA-dihydrouridine synthase [Planctomycetota bacterium]REK38910.1 MAG: tRNA-dihydrouridine synthase [Planctomycetota bacterium]